MRSLTAFFVGCALCACPPPVGGTDGGADGGPPAPTLEQYCDFITGSASCPLSTSCGLFSDESGCASYLAGISSIQYAFCANARLGVDAGTLLFDAHAAATCRASYGECGDSQGACAQVIIGAAGNGAACDSLTPCQPDFYCASDGTCPGHCAPRKPGGSEVFIEQACADSTYAKPATDGGLSYTCTARIGLGHSCTQYNSCIAGAACDSTGTCSPPGTANSLCGAPAQFSPFCAPVFGFACQPQPDGGAARCGPRARRGEPCGFCVSDLRCVITDGGTFGVCGDRAAQGEPCTLFGDCASENLTCEGNQCVPLPGEGESCAQSSRCAGDLSCATNFLEDGGSWTRCESYDAGPANVPTCYRTEYP